MDGHFELEQMLGAGAFGTVYLAERVARGRGNDGEQFAVKVMPMPGRTSTQEKQLAAELSLQMEVSGHKNVVHAREVSRATLRGEEFACIRMDLCDGDMLDAMNHGAFIKEKSARSAFLQIIDGVMHLHEKGVFHRDLKFENVLCATAEGKEICLKIADFGLATKDTLVPYGRYAGTPRYMPPECVSLALRGPQYSPAHQDIWAIGIMLAIVFGGNGAPWKAACPVSDPDFLGYFTDSSKLSDYLPDASPELVDFLQFKVLTVDPLKRASLQEIRKFVEKKPLFKKEGFFSKFFKP
ncbi:CBL-interacting serine threonine-protein kinase [Stygiomarasmius scandens]|uniref:non-specific serine/threonine protein kinase n=1 Tax=Marasmiellus scandens TaxID=2682957 RepID=A0ABR1JZG2_9AGAR